MGREGLSLHHAWVLPLGTEARYSVTTNLKGRNRALPDRPSQTEGRCKQHRQECE